jgi:hypothetical protein
MGEEKKTQPMCDFPPPDSAALLILNLPSSAKSGFNS